MGNEEKFVELGEGKNIKAWRYPKISRSKMSLPLHPFIFGALGIYGAAVAQSKGYRIPIHPFIFVAFVFITVKTYRRSKASDQTVESHGIH